MDYNQLSLFKEDEYKAPKNAKALLWDGEGPKKVKAPKPPQGVTVPKGYHWCPYCSMSVKLVKDKKLGIKRCPICSMSSRDYHMKNANLNL